MSKDKHDNKHESKEKSLMIGGGGVIEMLKDVLKTVQDTLDKKGADKDIQVTTSDDMPLPDSLSGSLPMHLMGGPLELIGGDDMACGDPVVDALDKDHGGLNGIIKIVRIVTPESVEKLASVIDHLDNVRTASRRDLMRKAFLSIQYARGCDNEAVTMERIASQQPEKSRGHYQAQAVDLLTRLAADSANSAERHILENARQAVLQGEDATLDAAAFRVRNLFASATPAQNVRVAYTTLATQAGEPFLLCPKGQKVFGHAVPMEISKCRENCIDSRTDHEGKVSCAYADWLRTADTHDKAMGRLDVHRHPDNATNLNLAEGERAKALTPDEIGYEGRFEESKQGVNKMRGKVDVEESREKQLEESKPVAWGHQGDGTPLSEINIKKAQFNFARFAQTDSMKTLEEQVPSNTAVGDKTMEEQLRGADKADVPSVPINEQLATTNGLTGNRGEAEHSAAQALEAVDTAATESVSEELNARPDTANTESFPEMLNKTAGKYTSKLVELDAEKNEGIEAQMEGKHHGEPDDATIEAMLEDQHAGLTEEELDMLLEEWLAQSREEAK